MTKVDLQRSSENKFDSWSTLDFGVSLDPRSLPQAFLKLRFRHGSIFKNATFWSFCSKIYILVFKNCFSGNH